MKRMDRAEPLSESRIVCAIAEKVCQRITRRVIATLQGMKKSLLSGDDSGLRNTWDEICVQVQDDASEYWDSYDHTVRSLLMEQVKALPDFEREAVWLQSREGEDWTYEDEEERPAHPVCNDDIVGYLAESYIYAKAADWSNSRIRAFLDRYDCWD